MSVWPAPFYAILSKKMVLISGLKTAKHEQNINSVLKINAPNNGATMLKGGQGVVGGKILVAGPLNK